MIATPSHSRSAWAMTWVEKITVVPSLGQAADQHFQLALVDRVEAGKRLVQHHQPRLVHQRAEQLHGLRHALGQLADLPVGGMAEAVLFQQFAPALAPFGQRQAAQRAHEGDRLIRLHRRIQAALLGQIADQPGDIVRPVMPEHAAHALVGIDDAQQHPQRGGLARAVGAENAVDRAFGHGQVDPVDRQRPVEPLDQPARLDRQRAGVAVLAARWLASSLRPSVTRRYSPSVNSEQDSIMVNAELIAATSAAIARRRRRELGFAAIGFAPAADDPLRARRLREWLDAGMHGDDGMDGGRAPPCARVRRACGPRRKA